VFVRDRSRKSAIETHKAVVLFGHVRGAMIRTVAWVQLWV
jgi:hypothetical protein